MALGELTKDGVKRELSGRASDLLNQLVPPADAAGGQGRKGVPPDVQNLGEELFAPPRPPSPRGADPLRNPVSSEIPGWLMGRDRWEAGFS